MNKKDIINEQIETLQMWKETIAFDEEEFEQLDATLKALELGKLYKEFFDKLDMNLALDQYDDWEGTHDYEILEVQIEDTYFSNEKLLELFKKIKEKEK